MPHHHQVTYLVVELDPAEVTSNPPELVDPVASVTHCDDRFQVSHAITAATAAGHDWNVFRRIGTQRKLERVAVTYPYDPMKITIQ